MDASQCRRRFLRCRAGPEGFVARITRFMAAFVASNLSGPTVIEHLREITEKLLYFHLYPVLFFPRTDAFRMATSRMMPSFFST